MKILKFVRGILIIALFGILILLSYYLVMANFEHPASELSKIESNLFDKPSPANWIKENQIQIYKDKVVILIQNATLSRYAATKSMDPAIDSYANGIEIIPESTEQLHVGDIIAYAPKNNDGLIVHRIIEIGADEKGWYAVAKGDNALQSDGKVRFEQIKYVTIAIIY